MITTRSTHIYNIKLSQVKIWQLCGGWTEINETWQEAKSQRPPSGLCFSGRSEQIWLSLPLIGWDNFDVVSLTAERNSTKLDRKQDLNVKVCAFRADQKNRIPVLSYLSIKVAHCTQVHDMWPFGSLVYCSENKMTSDWPGHFRHLRNNQMEFYETTESKNSTSCTKFLTRRPVPRFCWGFFSGRSEQNKDSHPASDWRRHFRLLCNHWQNLTKLDRKQELNVLYKFFFSGQSENNDGRHCLWLAEKSSTSLQPNKILTKLGREQELSSLNQVCVGPIVKPRWPTRPKIGLDIFYLELWNGWMELTILDRKQVLNVIYQDFVFRSSTSSTKVVFSGPINFNCNRWMEFVEAWQEARTQLHVSTGGGGGGYR